MRRSVFNQVLFLALLISSASTGNKPDTDGKPSIRKVTLCGLVEHQRELQGRLVQLTVEIRNGEELFMLDPTCGARISIFLPTVEIMPKVTFKPRRDRLWSDFECSLVVGRASQVNDKRNCEYSPVIATVIGRFDSQVFEWQVKEPRIVLKQVLRVRKVKASGPYNPISP
jgi:hypothetical protein